MENYISMTDSHTEHVTVTRNDEFTSYEYPKIIDSEIRKDITA